VLSLLHAGHCINGSKGSINIREERLVEQHEDFYYKDLQSCNRERRRVGRGGRQDRRYRSLIPSLTYCSQNAGGVIRPAQRRSRSLKTHREITLMKDRREKKKNGGKKKIGKEMSPENAF